MPTLNTLQEKDLRQVMNSNSLKRARGYTARVHNGLRSGNTLRAEVRGSRLYQVEIDVAEDGILAACSCPYDWGGYCKHIGAVLYRWMQTPESFTIEANPPAAADNEIETFSVAPPPAAVPDQKPYWLAYPHQQRCEMDDQNLRTWLKQYKIKELRQMAKKQDWHISGTRKDDIVQQIVSQMLQPGIALKNVLSLDAEHLRVFHALGGLYTGIFFQESYIEKLARQWGPLTQYKNIGTYTGHLCEKGLVMPGHFVDSYPKRIDWVPASLLRVLPPLLTERVAAADLPDHAASGVRRAESRPFLQRLHQILILLEQSQPALRSPMPRPRLEKFYDFLQEWDYVPAEIKQARQEQKLNDREARFSLTVPPPPPSLPDDTIEKLAPVAGDPARLEFFYHLLLAAGLLQPGSPVTIWPEVREQFLRRSEVAQWSALVQAYLSLSTWSELSLVQAERPSLQLKRNNQNYYRPPAPPHLYQLLTAFRLQVIHLLACLPDDRWVAISDITDLLRPIWPRFDSWCWTPANFITDSTRPAWALYENGRFLDTANDAAAWHQAQGAFVRHLIQGPLHWLGLADVSFEYDQPIAFRLHGLHTLFFDKAAAVPLSGTAADQEQAAVSAAAPAAPVTVTGTTIIVDPAAVSARAHHYLDQIALLETAETSRFVYRLHAAAAHEAFESGQTLALIVEGWETWLDMPLPAAIREQLTAWWQAYGQVRLYEDVTVIEFGDEYALAEMKAATSLEKHLIAEISPHLVIIPAQAVGRLVAELEKAGYTPKQSQTV